MIINANLEIDNDEYAYLLSVLYADRKRLTDLSDHAIGHGEVVIFPGTGALSKLINHLEHGAMVGANQAAE